MERTDMHAGTIRHDRATLVALFGGAMSVGVLFLPVQAGIVGIWPLLLSAVVLPLAWFSQRAQIRLLLSHASGQDIPHIVATDLHPVAGVITRLLLMALYLALAIACATSLMNIVATLFENQLGLESIPRPLLAAVLALGLSAAMLTVGEEQIQRVSALSAYPLIAILLFLSLYLIPQWHASGLMVMPPPRTLVKGLLLLFPLLLFSLDGSALCALLASSYRASYPDVRMAMRRSDRPLLWSSLLLLVFVLVFALSCLLAIHPQDMGYARLHNIDILTALSLQLSSPLLRMLCPLLAFVVLLHAYFRLFMLARGELVAMLTQLRSDSGQHHEWASTLLLALPLWLPTLSDPSILHIIGMLVLPLLALQTYLIPAWLLHYVPRLAPYRERSQVWLLVSGLMLASSYALGRWL
jgi:serine transporter